MAISTGFPERAETLSVMRLVVEYCGSVCRPDVFLEGKRLAARSFVGAVTAYGNACRCMAELAKDGRQ